MGSFKLGIANAFASARGLPIFLAGFSMASSSGRLHFRMNFFFSFQTANLETEGEKRLGTELREPSCGENLQNEGILGQARLCELVPAEVLFCWSL